MGKVPQPSEKVLLRFKIYRRDSDQDAFAVKLGHGFAVIDGVEAKGQSKPVEKKTM